MDYEKGYVALRNLLKETAPFMGEVFLKAAVKAFSKEFSADFVFITRILEKKQHIVEVLAAWRDGKELAGWEFSLPGTPCELIYQPELEEPWTSMRVGQTVTIAEDVFQLFEATKGTTYHSFIGVPLWDKKRKMVGHIALFFERNLVDDNQRNFIVELAELFSYKVQAELNRMLLEQARENLLAELHVINERLGQESITDSLTHLYNRRYFNQRMQQAFARMHRAGEQYALMLVDLDSLKGLNDKHGHNVGDMAISQIAEALLKNTRREVETVFRIGGDEFAILIQEQISVEALVSLGQRMNASVRNLALISKGTRLPLSVSVGVALSMPGDSSWKDIYVRTDKALYVAKNSGRNQTAVSA